MHKIIVKSSSLFSFSKKLPETLTFEETIEQKTAYKEIIAKIKTKLSSQYNKQIIKFQVNNSFDLELTKDNLFSYLLYIAQEAQDEFNNLNNLELELPSEIKDKINNLVNITFNGGSIDYYNQPIGEIQQRKYDGLISTQTRLLKPIETLNAQQIKLLVDNDVSRITESLFLPFFKFSFEKMALADNQNIVGCIAVKDNRTRTRHYTNSGIAIIVGSYRKDGTDPFYYQESNCRCRQYYFKSIKDAIEAGFSFQQ